jgi:hypothetical protein
MRRSRLQGQQIEIDAALADGILHLIDQRLIAVGQRQPLGHVLHVEIGDAEGADLARLHQIVEPGHRLGEWDRAAPMQQIEIDAIGLHPFQRGLASLDRSSAGGVLRQHLADQIDAVAPALDRGAHHLLGAAGRVHLRRVDQGGAVVDAGLQRPHLLRALPHIITHMPGAEPDRRHTRPVSQCDLSHASLALFQ